MKTAFLTGGTGFVGANVVRELLASGWRVRALARVGSDRRNLDGLDLEILDGGLGDVDLETSIGPVEAVFHVAAHYSLYRADAAVLHASNVEGTRNVLRAARAAGAGRFVYTSSVAAIGVRHGGVADETFQSPRAALIGAYKKSKFDAEREVLAAASAGQDVVIVNPTTPIGPWDRKPTPTGEIFVRFLTGGMPVAVDTGLNFVDVRDVARGHLLAFERGRPGERYILGGENLPLTALLDRVGAKVGRRAPRRRIPHWIPLAAAYVDELVLARFGKRAAIPIDGVAMSRESMYYESSKAKRELGFEAAPIDVAIDETIRWFSDHGYLGASPPRLH